MITKSTIISWLGTDKNDLAQRMLKLIRSGHNITEYLIDNNDIFVYEKECINEQIIKKTPNKPQIGSIVQLLKCINILKITDIIIGIVNIFLIMDKIINQLINFLLIKISNNI